MVKLRITLFIFFLFVSFCSVGQIDTAVYFSREEFSKINYIKQALVGLSKDCKIVSYEISMYMINGVKTKTYTVGIKDDFTKLFIDHAQRNGGEMTVSKLKTSCAEGTHKTTYKIIVK
jgi:hypothetical protein